MSTLDGIVLREGGGESYLFLMLTKVEYYNKNLYIIYVFSIAVIVIKKKIGYR